MKKRILALVLSVLMLVAMMPVSVFATEATCPGFEMKHTPDNCSNTVVETVAPTCGAYGYTLYRCNECDHLFAANPVDPVADAHDWVEILAADPADCTNPGTTAKYECSICKQTKGGAVDPATQHFNKVLNAEKTVAGNCTTQGKTVYDCPDCGEEIVILTPATGEGHKWEKKPSVIVKEPTCDEEGEALVECENCDEQLTVTIKRLCSHNLKDVAKDDATCTTDGKIAHKICLDCGELFDADGVSYGLYRDDEGVITDEYGNVIEDTEDAYADPTYVAALGHYHLPTAAKTNVVEATCETAGSYTATCARCNKPITFEVPALEHKWAEEGIYQAPTCTDMGYMFYGCTVCAKIDYDRTIMIPKLGHTTYEDIHTDECVADCKEHSYDQAGTTATCVQAGAVTWTCGRCNQPQRDAQEALGHIEETQKVDATCKVYGYTFTYCTRPNCDVMDGDAAVANTPVYETTVDGLKYDVAKYTPGEYGTLIANPVALVSITVDKNGGYDGNNHNIVTDAINPSTCTEEGQYKTYCKWCHAVDEVVEIKPALDHDFDVADLTIYPVKTQQTCTTGLVYIVSCKRGCGETQDTKDPIKGQPLGHDPILETLNVVYPKCDGTVGYDEYDCSRCSEKVKMNEVSYVHKPEHEWNKETEHPFEIHRLNLKSVEIFRPGDCYTVGLEKYHCDVCDKNILIIIPLTGSHQMPANLGDKPANATATSEYKGKAETCTENGYTAQYTCTVCNEFVKSKDIDEIDGHNFVVTVPGSAPNCTVNGKKDLAVCDRTGCGAVDPERDGSDIIAKHTWGNEIPVDPATCTEDGVKAHYVCSVCNAKGLKVGEGESAVITAIDVTAACDAECEEEHEHVTVEAIYEAALKINALDHNNVLHGYQNLIPWCGDIVLKDAEGYAIILVEGEDGVINQVRITDFDDVVFEDNYVCRQFQLYVCARCNDYGYIKSCDESNGDHTPVYVPEKNHNYTNAGYCVTEDDVCADDCAEEHTHVTEAEVCPAVCAEHSLRPTCEDKGYNLMKCDCGDSFKYEVAEDKHVNAAGQKFINSCVDETVDRFCTVCQKTIGKDKHLNQVKNQAFPADCLTDGYATIDCADCGAELATVIEPALGHMDGEATYDVEGAMQPTYSAAGIAGYVCGRCGDIKYVEVDAEEGGLDYYLNIYNVNTGNKDFSDSHLVAVEVIVNSLDCDVWSIYLDIQFDNTKLNFVDYNNALTNKFVAPFVTEPAAVTGNVVNVFAASPAQNKTEEGDMQMANVDGEVILAVLYFEVDYADDATVAFEIKNISALDLDDDLTNDPGAIVTNDSIVIDQFMDIDGNNQITDADVQMAYKLYIEGMNGVDYDVTLDLDKDGNLTATDIRNLALYVNGTLDYDDVRALTADIDA